MLTVNHYWDQTKSSKLGGNIWKKKVQKKIDILIYFFKYTNLNPWKRVQSTQNAFLTFPLFPPEILNITKKNQEFYF
jgi:hypothetical protein